MLTCDFNKVAVQFGTSAWVFSCKFAVYFQNPSPKNSSRGPLLVVSSLYRQIDTA